MMDDFGAMEVIGYTPWIDDDRVKQLDGAIAALHREITQAKSPRLDAPWRRQWRAFMRRWALERDSYASWADQLSPIEGGARVEAFGANYLWWSASFEARSGKSVQAVPAIKPELEPMPIEVWIILGAGVVAFAFTKGLR